MPKAKPFYRYTGKPWTNDAGETQTPLRSCLTKFDLHSQFAFSVKTSAAAATNPSWVISGGTNAGVSVASFKHAR
jgi:hypothetical protein